MRRNQAIAGAIVAALLAWLDIVGFVRCVVYLWPSLGPTGLILTLGRESCVESCVRSFTPSTRRDASRRGFGDYGIQAHDGERTISLEDQQDQVARHLVSFLKRVGKRG